MKTRFSSKSDIFNVAVTIIADVRKDWKTYSKANLWMICIVDMLIALLYNIIILREPADQYTTYLMVEIWIRPTITYGLVACYVKEKED